MVTTPPPVPPTRPEALTVPIVGALLLHDPPPGLLDSATVVPWQIVVAAVGVIALGPAFTVTTRVPMHPATV